MIEEIKEILQKHGYQLIEASRSEPIVDTAGQFPFVQTVTHTTLTLVAKKTIVEG